MYIECKNYNLIEFKKVLNITKWQWEERKEELLEHLKLFFDYEITLNGRSYNIIIKQQYSDYEPLPRKNQMSERSKFYEDEADHILQYKPRNTASNVAREIVSYNNKYNHKESTVANYIRPHLKRNYTVTDKEWCEIDYLNCSYNPITSEQLKYLNKLFEKYLSSKEVANVIADVESGYISKEDIYNNLKGSYNNAMDAFYQEYGFRPYKAGELRKNAWIIDEENK